MLQSIPWNGRRHYGTGSARERHDGLHRRRPGTEAIRRAIQHRQESLRALAKRHGSEEGQKTIQWIVFPATQKTVAKWKKRTSVTDVPTGPTVAKSTVLSVEDEAVIVAFRGHTLLALDDCLYALQPTIPHLTRSSLHRWRHAPRHQSPARGRRRQPRQEEVQDLPARLLPR